MDATESLEALAESLEAKGFRTVWRNDRMALVVINPVAGDLRETIRCGPDDVEALSFLWSWGPAIAPVEDIDLATSRIVHVLKAVDE